MERDPVAEVQRLRAELAAAPGPPQRVLLLQRLATLLETELGDVEAALEALETAAQFDPTDTGCLRALSRLCERTGRWVELCAVLEQRSALAETKVEAVAILRDLARVCEDQLADLERAREALRRILDILPGDEAAAELARLERELAG